MKPSQVWLLLSIIFLLTGCKTTEVTALKTDNDIEHCVLKKKGIGWNEVEFCQYNPVKGSAGSDKKLPLILFLHGTPPVKFTLDDLTKSEIFAKAKERNDFILLAPRSPRGKGWPTPVLDAILKEAEKSLPIDTDRIYVTGFSMGGIATWRYAFEQPERFAAIIPVCGYGDPSQLWKTMHLPTWLTHGDNDPTVNVSGSIIMYDNLKTIGADPKITIYPNTGHNAWSPTYKRDEIYDWMLAQKRPPAKPTSYAKLYCSLLKAVNVETKTIYLTDNNPKEATVKIKITNNSKNKEVSFSAKLSLPEGITSDTSSLNFTLHPLEEKEIPVTVYSTSLNSIADIKGINLNWNSSFTTDDKKTVSFKEKILPICITQLHDCPKTDIPIIVDGNLNEWKNFPYELKTHDGNARFSIVHNDNDLYVAVNVIDADVNVKPNKAPWQQDGIEARIDARPDPERSISKRYWEYETIFLAALCPSTNEKGGVYFNENKMPAGTEALCRTTANGYVLELKIPGDYLNTMQKKNWSKFRFNLTVDDSDNGKQYQTSWQPDWRSLNRKPAFGTFSRQ